MQRNITILTSAALAAVAGSASAGQPELFARDTLKSNHVAHIYYNVATGEKVATLLNTDVRPAADEGSEVWISANSLPCAAFGQTGGFFGVMDTPDCTTCFTSTATGQIFLDWGDLPFDHGVEGLGLLDTVEDHFYIIIGVGRISMRGIDFPIIREAVYR